MTIEDFYFGANQVPSLDCQRTRYYGYLRRIANQNLQELKDQKIQDEMDFIIEQREIEKRNYSFRTWLFNNKINSNDHYIKDLKNKLDTSFFRYVSKDGLFIDSGLIPLMIGENWITEDQSKDTKSIDILLEFYDYNPINPNFNKYFYD